MGSPEPSLRGGATDTAVTFCSACGAALQPGDLFCGECGVAVAGAALASSFAPCGSPRRRLVAWAVVGGAALAVAVLAVCLWGPIKTSLSGSRKRATTSSEGRTDDGGDPADTSDPRAVQKQPAPQPATSTTATPPEGKVVPPEKVVTPAPDRRKGKDYAPFPNPDAGYVTDLAKLLTPAQEAEIERWLWHVERKTGVEMAVVTIGSIHDHPGAPEGSIVEFARALFDKYGIGNLPKNDGVLLLVAHKDRKVRIELGAFYGRDRDADAARIMGRTIIPRFKAGEFPLGIRQGVEELIRVFAGEAKPGAPAE